jgi:hypothetical protein
MKDAADFQGSEGKQEPEKSRRIKILRRSRRFELTSTTMWSWKQEKTVTRKIC